jgi:hypothetical protein
MKLSRLILSLGLLCSCDTIAPPAGDASVGGAEPEPLPADLVAACPDSTRFKRSSSGPCTQIGCQSGYVLNVSPSSAWASGDYRFELTVDGREIRCQGSLPLKACGERSFSCDADGVRLGESGCALPANQHGIATIDLEGFPLELAIRVLKNGDEIASTKLTPKYIAGQPNGPGCDPICCSASSTLEVPVGP